MKVVLTKDVKNFGRRGDIKEVSDGYANNFLFAKGYAVPASKSAVTKIGEKKNSENIEEKRFKEKLKAIAQNIPEFKLKSGNKGEAFGSVKPEDIEKEIKKAGIENPKVEMPKPIKEFGEFEVVVGIGRGVKDKIKIKVSPLQ